MNKTDRRKIALCFIFPLILLSQGKLLKAQTNWFADGYHGGVYGHYPLWVTQFMADTLNRYGDWMINVEIEPETWDTVKVLDPKGYAAFSKLFSDQTSRGRIEYVNPSYGQSYLFNINGESVIRQFQFGINSLKQHFPTAKFTTYSSEEPCFTSALPQILSSLGFTHAVLKNPNTCWGGYTRAFGGETINWIGPDGTSILTAPRYASEELEPNSTWQTTAWNNSPSYIEAAFAQGIRHPVGMCLQDAGWRNGRWLGSLQGKNTSYTTWRNYFSNIANKESQESWRVSQEDIQVSLVWGSQVLQQIAQQVRFSENKITRAEKLASLAKLYVGLAYPEDSLNAAWRTLLLAQHHDCWIVPYNGVHGSTWADKVKVWTGFTSDKSDEIMHRSAEALVRKSPQSPANYAIFNTTGFDRDEVISLPKNLLRSKGDDSKTPVFEGGQLFRVKVPAMGYAVFDLSDIENNSEEGAKVAVSEDGICTMETDLYKITINAEKGGAISSLIAKQLHNKEFVDQDNPVFNSLRGNFYKSGGLLSSTGSKAKISVIENGPLRIKVEVRGSIGESSYKQTVQLTQGDVKIECRLQVEYSGDLRVGEDYMQDSGYSATDLHKAFYNDTSKLIAIFPLALSNQKVYKDAPFDVTESKLNNTFFNRWDSIKNNIILNWVDITDADKNYGFAILSDHTTSYLHGENFPPGLTVQYAGVGLWGRNYHTDDATDISYAFIPHKGKWDEEGLFKETEKWNFPLYAIPSTEEAGTKRSLVNTGETGWQITAITYEDNDLLIRFFNAEGGAEEHTINFDCKADDVQLVELNGEQIQTLSPRLQAGKVSVRLAIPRFGLRTVRLINPAP